MKLVEAKKDPCHDTRYGIGTSRQNHSEVTVYLSREVSVPIASAMDELEAIFPCMG